MCILLHLLQYLFHIVHLFSLQRTFKLRLSLYLCFMATKAPVLFHYTDVCDNISSVIVFFYSSSILPFWLKIPDLHFTERHFAALPPAVVLETTMVLFLLALVTSIHSAYIQEYISKLRYQFYLFIYVLP